MALNGRIFKDITGTDFREFHGDTAAILKCAQEANHQRISDLVHSANFFKPEGSGWIGKLGIGNEEMIEANN